MIKFFSFIVLSFIILFAGCGKRKIVDKDKLANVYISILLAEDSLSFAPDSLMKVKKNIFAENNIDEKEYMLQLDAFGEDKEEWESFFNLVTAKLDSMIAVEDSLKKETDKKKINPKKFLSENRKALDGK